MIDLRIDTTPYRLLLNAPREQKKPSPGRSLPLKDAAENPAVNLKRAPIDLLAIPPQSVSPALAASIYQANIPTEIYTYPFHVPPKEQSDTTGNSGNVRGGQGHEAVTLIQYEPGTLVDCHA
ncbi:hypothetical protein [Geobacter argillaceus]|uniref:Uncharacterized protein n=1 Tax=Geobacter argillaceus TaxID=345631 RepID=A0A562WR66_9BACT|nr:hypothetical protein [Geobacter argillaceus]TWJ32899.1 hypothetical protein JN12_00309 [Geobacter argillaceus]